jgi:N,N'-diacetyllegionaminate synthase
MSLFEKIKNHVYIIAEAGVNHGGNIDLAKKMIDIASEACADAVKFQAFRTEHVIIDNVEKAPYQRETTDSKQSQTEMLKALELKKEAYVQLMDYCKQKNIDFLITPFDEYSLIELEEIGVEAYKIASTDTTNIPFLRKVARTGKPIFLSTGMCYLDEVEMAVKAILEINTNLILLQCTANYPIQDDEANLNVLNTFKEKFDCILGFSDHTIGLGASLFAIPMGAKVVEKHFTIDKSFDGPDHRASLTPTELKGFVLEIRRIEKYLGSSEKRPTDSEKLTKKSLQKCLVAAQNIKKGEKFSENNLIAKRTGGIGISPLFYDQILGTFAPKDFNKNDIISIE